MAKRVAARAETNTSRVRALSAEGFTCEECLFLDTPWKQGRSTSEKSCRERGYGNQLCGAFSDKRAQARCGHCEYLDNPDPDEGVACRVEYNRKEDELSCEHFAMRITDLDSDDLVLIHAGLPTDGVKYIDTPKTPISVRFGDVGIMIEPASRKNGISFKVTPFSLDPDGDMVLIQESDAAVARPVGTVSVGSDIYRDVAVTVTPKVRSYKKRLRLADKADNVPTSVKRILKSAVTAEDLKTIPSAIIDEFAQLRAENVAMSMAATIAIRNYGKHKDVEPVEGDTWKRILVRSEQGKK